MIRTPIKIKPMPWNDERIETLKELWRDGLSCAQIAAELGGCSRSAVLGKARRLKLPSRSNASIKPVQKKPRSSIRNRLVIVNADTGETTDIRSLENEPVALSMPDGKHFGTLEIGTNQCRWPHGDVKTGGVHYCAHPGKKDSPYCSHHTSRAWDHKGTAKSQQKAKDASESYAREHRRAA